MNKNFFKIDHKIKLLDILDILNISQNEFFSQNSKNKDLLEKNFVEDFVSFENLKKNKLSFLINIKSNFNKVSSGICIVEKENVKLLHNDIIKIPFNYPKKGFADILQVYFEKNKIKNKQKNIHPLSSIHKSAKIGKNVFIGEFTKIAEGVIIEDNTHVSERVSISANCKIGKNCFIGAGVVIECTIMDKKVVVSHNSVLGKAGFGFVPNGHRTKLIPHIGGLKIGEGTNIGSGCTIDRGLIDNTSIGKYVMIDNQVHIGHNCIIEDFCILAGKVGLSGSVFLEKNVVLGGDVSIKDNIRIGQDTIVAGASKVFNNFPKGSKIGGSPAIDINSWKRIIASQRLNYIKRKNK